MILRNLGTTSWSCLGWFVAALVLASWYAPPPRACAQGPSATDPDPSTSPTTLVPAEPPPTVFVQPVPPPASVPGGAQPADPSKDPSNAGAPLAPVAVQVAVPMVEPNARLDYNDGSFSLRSRHDNLVLTIGARAHLDLYAYGGPGVSDYQRSSNGTGLKPNLFFRRFIFEFGGMIRKKWFFWLGGNFGQTTLAGDNSQDPISTAGVYDGFVGYTPIPTLKIYFGQFNEPFTMENVTSSRWLDMMERALIVRTVATPYNKAEGLMAWGETRAKHFEYQVGVFGGDGQNRPNLDDRFDGTLRLVARPFASRSQAFKRAHVGVGGRIGRRDSHFVRYDAPSLNTPGGYAFWSSTYDAGAAGDTHVVPSRLQAATSGELYLPFERWDFKGEVVYVHEERREVLASDRSKSLRGGLFSGIGGYGQLSFWLLGSARINGNPAGYYGMTKLPDGTTGNEFPHALQLVARGEIVRLNYDSNSRFGDEGQLANKTQNIDVNVYQLAINYWATKHVRLTAEYSFYQFPGTPSGSAPGTVDNQAVAPGARSGGTAPDANSLHEISFRAGLAL